jgi:bifunctional non-homologous end joining protein LigD
MIYDLDPPQDTRNFDAVRRAALDLRDVLAELDLQSWVQTTGSKGFHLIVPLDRDWAFDRVRDFAEKVSLLLVRRHEERYTLEHRKKNRKGRIFLDYLRNAYGATSVAPYAVRAQPEASVATPVRWDEVAEGASPRDWTMKDIPRRLGQMDDPWQGLMRHAYHLAGRQDALEDLLDQEPPAEEED